MVAAADWLIGGNVSVTRACAQQKTLRDLPFKGRNIPLRNNIRCAVFPPHEIGVLDRYLTTKNPSPPDVTTTIPDLKNG